MTFDDDFAQLEFPHATRRFRVQAMGLSWPPPETIDFGGFVFHRESFSQITDEQREGMSAICRGARYVPKEQDQPAP